MRIPFSKFGVKLFKEGIKTDDEIGKTGTSIYDGMISDEDYVSELTGSSSITTYDKMRKSDGIVGAVLLACELPIRAAHFYIEPASSEQKDIDIANFIEYNLLSGMTITWDDFLRQALLMLPFGFCVKKGSRIIKANGIPEKIENIKKGDEIITGKGIVKKVIEVSKRKVNEDLIKIKCRGIAEELNLTKEHIILTDKGEKKVSDLQVGDILIQPRLKLEEGGDYQSGWLLGFYLAEGNRRKDSKNGIIFSVHENEVNGLVRRLVKWLSWRIKDVIELKNEGLSLREIIKQTKHNFRSIKKLLNGNSLRSDKPNVFYSKTSKGAYVKISQEVFKSFIDEWATNGGAFEKALKKLPIQKEFIKGILDGWSEGDGCQTKNSTIISGFTSSEKLAYQLQLLAVSIGLPAHLSTQITSGGFSDKPTRRWILKLTRPFLMGNRKGCTGKKNKNKVQGQQSNVCMDYVERKIENITKENYVGEVYDLAIKDVHSYLCEGVAIHNSVFEKVFTAMEYEGQSLIGWKKFAPRLPASIFKWTTAEGEDGIQQMLNNGKNVSIPIEKLLIFTHRKEGDNWLGTSILRNAYRSWFFKQHIEKINAIAFERQGMGIPDVQLPEGHTPADKDKAEEIAKNMRANEKAYLIRPFGWEVGFMDMKANTLKDPNNTIARYNREIMTSILAQFMDLGSGSTGSYALSSDQSSIFENSLRAIANQVCDVLNNYAIKQLVDVNWDVKDYPTMKYTRIGKLNIRDFSVSMQQLTQAGVITPTSELEDFVRENLNLPEKPEEEEIEEKKEVPKKKEDEDEEETIEEKNAKEFQELMFRRPLTFAEHKVNWVELNNKIVKGEKEAGKRLGDILTKIGNDLIKKVQTILSNPDNAERRKSLLALTTSYQSEYRKEVYNSLKESFEYGKLTGAREMHKELPTTPSKEALNISMKADTLTEVMNNDFVREAKLALVNVLEGKKMAEDIPLSLALGLISKAIKNKVKSLTDNTASVIMSGGINQGRRLIFEIHDKDIYALQRSEILDERTCAFCESMDGRVLKKTDPLTKEDGFHFKCRGLWVEILKDELEKPEIAGVPDSVRSSYHGFSKIT